jgi:hypothetical protein
VLLVYKVIPEVLQVQLVQTENKVLLAIPVERQGLLGLQGQLVLRGHLVGLQEPRALLAQLGFKVIPVVRLELLDRKEQLVYSQAAQAALIMSLSVLMELEAQHSRTPPLLLMIQLIHSQELLVTQQQI